MANIKHSKELADRIIRAIQDGATQRAAAKMGGITEETLSIWKKKFPAFGQAVERAHGAAQVFAERSLLRMAARGNVTAVVFWLKNRHPGEWVESQRREINVKTTFEDWVAGPEAPTNEDQAKDSNHDSAR